MQGFIISLIIFTSIFALFGLGLNLQWGFTGLINFGHVAFMTLGAYTTVLLSMQGVPLLLATLIGALVAAGLGLLMGFATLRLRTDYLAIVTIGVSEMIRLIAVNEGWLTRGTLGLQGFPLPLASLNPTLPIRIGMLLLITAIVALGYRQLWRSLRQTVKKLPPEAIVPIGLTALGYGSSLGLLLVGTGWAAKQLKPLLPAWALGCLLLLALTLIGYFYIKFAQRLTRRRPQWSTGLMLVSTIALALCGLWIYGIAIDAIYHYEKSPAKTGLMVISVAILALIYWGLEKLVRSPWGRVLKAIREDEEVAKALGKNVFAYKLQVLMLGGAIAGIAGALYSWQLTTVYPDNFPPLVTFDAWTIVVLGGAGNNAGTLLGSAIFWAYYNITRFILGDIVPLDDARLGAFRIMLIGLLLMVVMVWRPQGILGKKEELTLGQ
ncbi:MAG TPA: branched-chain amino acid ABC transporter permease [Coleofasciculaceae cyanobacterium]|jgi:neutral amino acid transport system permease protein